jgi:hypothetical protein
VLFHYLRIFTMQTPFGLPVKITVSVTPYNGERIAEQWKMVPYDVVDAFGRNAKQVETKDHLIAIEWLVPKEEPKSSNPVTWGGITAWPKNRQGEKS